MKSWERRKDYKWKQNIADPTKWKQNPLMNTIIKRRLQFCGHIEQDWPGSPTEPNFIKKNNIAVV